MEEEKEGETGAETEAGENEKFFLSRPKRREPNHFVDINLQ